MGSESSHWLDRLLKNRIIWDSKWRAGGTFRQDKWLPGAARVSEKSRLDMPNEVLRMIARASYGVRCNTSRAASQSKADVDPGSSLACSFEDHIRFRVGREISKSNIARCMTYGEDDFVGGQEM